MIYGLDIQNNFVDISKSCSIYEVKKMKVKCSYLLDKKNTLGPINFTLLLDNSLYDSKSIIIENGSHFFSIGRELYEIDDKKFIVNWINSNSNMLTIYFTAKKNELKDIYITSLDHYNYFTYFNDLSYGFFLGVRLIYILILLMIYIIKKEKIVIYTTFLVFSTFGFVFLSRDSFDDLSYNTYFILYNLCNYIVIFSKILIITCLFDLKNSKFYKILIIPSGFICILFPLLYLFFGSSYFYFMLNILFSFLLIYISINFKTHKVFKFVIINELIYILYRLFYFIVYYDNDRFIFFNVEFHTIIEVTNIFTRDLFIIIASINKIFTEEINIYIQKFRKKIMEKKVLGFKLKKLNFEIKSLQYELNPKFLFGVIDLVSNVFNVDINQGKTLLLKTSEIYRDIVFYSKKEKIAIDSEIDLVKNILYIENIKTDKKLTVLFKFESSQNRKDILIPSLCIFSFLDFIIQNNIIENEKNEILISYTGITRDFYIKILVKINEEILKIYNKEFELICKNIKHKFELIYTKNYKVEILVDKCYLIIQYYVNIV